MSYKYSKPKNLTKGNNPYRILGANPQVLDVENAFGAMRSDGDHLAFGIDGHIPKEHYELDDPGDITDSKIMKTHFQGIQRLRRRNGNYLVVSGADAIDKASHLFVVEMGSRQTNGPWRSNLLDGVFPSSNDRIVNTIKVHPEKWHAGGISVSGDILAVPVYLTDPEDRCSIVFFHLRNPKKPEIFKDVEIDRPEVKAGAVALTQIASNGHYLVAVWSDSDKDPDRFDFYLSQSPDFFDGFDSDKKVTWRSGEKYGEKKGPEFGRYQAIGFIMQPGEGSRERIFIIGTYNTNPLGTGKNLVELFEVEFPDDLYSAKPMLKKPSRIIRRGKRKELKRRGEQFNLAAAGGVFIDEKGDTLRIYSAYYYRHNSFTHFAEFQPEIDSVKDKIDAVEDSFVELFGKSEYTGRRMSLRDASTGTFNNYMTLQAQGRDFDRRASAARFQLPEGYRYKLFSHTKCLGESVEFVGTGKVEEIKNFRRIPLGRIATASNAQGKKTINFDEKTRSSCM